MPGTRVKHIHLAKGLNIMLMSVCSLIKQWHFRPAEGGSSVAKFLNILSMLLCEEVNVTSSSSCWFIAPLPQISGLSRLYGQVITHQPGRLLVTPAELLGDHFVLPCVLQQMPQVALALGTTQQMAFPEEREMLWHTCGTRPLPTLNTMARPAAWLCYGRLWWVHLHACPLPSFPKRKCWASPQAGRDACSTVGGKAAAKYV